MTDELLQLARAQAALAGPLGVRGPGVEQVGPVVRGTPLGFPEPLRAHREDPRPRRARRSSSSVEEAPAAGGGGGRAGVIAAGAEGGAAARGALCSAGP